MKSKLIKGMLTACLFYPALSMAQIEIGAPNEIEALRYSQHTFGGTARSLSMGGAFGALGADFSSLSINPAGIGVYRRSEFAFSLGFNGRGTDSEYLGRTESDSRFSLDMPNLGLVLARTKKSESAEWKQVGFAFGYNRLANFSSDIYYEGKNTENSILDSFLEGLPSGGATPDDIYFDYPFDLDLAYQTYLINPIAPDSLFYSSVIPNGGAYQSMRKTTSGGMGEFSLGFGTSYKDVVYFGVSLGFPSIRYEEESTWSESDKDNEIFVADTNLVNRDFRSLRYNSYLETTGNGFNAKFGVIVRPIDWLRFGAAIHTPTWYNMSDIFSNSLSSAFDNPNNSYEFASPEGNFSYNLRTPFKASGSLAVIFQQYGLISVDYEITNFSSSKYEPKKLDRNDYTFSGVNRVIKTVYSPFTSNIRVGTEWRYEKFAFRAGFAYYMSPFEQGFVDENNDQTMMSYTGGVGFRDKRWFFDIGYGYTQHKSSSTPYFLASEEVPSAYHTRTDHRVITTVGWRF